MSIKAFIVGLVSIGAVMLAPTATAQFGGGEPGGPGGGSAEPPKPIVEWDKRQDPQGRLRAYGTDLLGDGIDPHTGTIVFNHTDVSLLGNSNLEVAVKRQRSGGLLYHRNVDAEFGDWEYQVPRMKVISPTSRAWTGARCTTFYASKFTQISQGSTHTSAHQYSEGVKMDVPGYGSQHVLENPVGNHWPSGTTHVTTGNWALKCGSASDGGQGFIATAPNGDVYRFDKFVSHQAKALGYINGSPIARNMYILAATQVTDVNGNWVKYVYDGAGRLTKIHSNDLREITLAYSGSSKLVGSVSANGRTWSYTYRTTDFFLPDWEPGAINNLNTKVLDRAYRPDGKHWLFDLDGMSAQPAPAKRCWKRQETLKVTHPYGVLGTFKIKDTLHRHVLYANISRGDRCPDPEAPPPQGFGPPAFYSSTTTSTMATLEKKLTGATIPTSTWAYTYEKDDGAGGSSSSERTNWTMVQGPNSHTTYVHNWTSEQQGGKMVSKDVRASSSGSVMDAADYTYNQEAGYGSTFAATSLNGGGVLTSIRPATRIQQRNGDTYTTQTSYNTNNASSSYSYGNPTQAVTSTSFSSPARTTVNTYAHNTTKWILGLPASVTVNGRNEATFVYDNYGQKTSQTRYGAPNATFSYNSDGTMSWFKDANNKQTSASSWKRGTPQTITRADGTTIEQNVDNNGWVMDTQDPNGNTVTYNRDNMGRMINAAPSGGWAPTSINYNFGSPITQTITKGTAVNKITYDNMFRPTLVKTGTSTPSYVKTTYNAAGQPIFTSFPSNSPNPTTGANMSYDGLGRPINSSENVSPYATTSHQYLSSNRHAVTDAEGNTTTYYQSGYNGPGQGALLSIHQPLGVVTTMHRNQWDELERLQQAGTQNGYTSDKSQYYQYDSRRRLCRHQTPEGGSTLYGYNTAGYLTSYAKGMANSGCPAPSGASKVSLTYDNIYRVTLTNYTDGGTPDIASTYDNNGNVLTLNRSGVNRTYTYDSANHLTSEILSLDGKNFPMTYTYNSNGFMTRRTLPTSRVLSYGLDDLGRNTSVAWGVTNYASGMTYHPSGAIAHINYGNGQVFDQYLNARLQPSRLYSRKGGNVALDLNYIYGDARSKVTQIINNAMSGDNRTYSYDDLGRLTGSTGSWGSGTYVYDALGNIRTKTEGGRTLVMNYNGSNRLYSHTDSGGLDRSLTYDTRGNVTALGALSFIYDYSDQPVFVSGANSNTQGEFGKIANAGIPGHNVEILSNTPLEQCQIECLGREYCKSVDFHRANQICYLQDVDQTDESLNYNYTGDPYDHYYRYPYEFGKIANAGIPGHNVEILSNTPLEQCQIECLGREYCKSVDFHRANQTCYLQDVDQTDESLNYNYTGDPYDHYYRYPSSSVTPGTYLYDGNMKRVRSSIAGKTIYNVFDASGALVHVDNVTTGEKTDYVSAGGKTIARLVGNTPTYLHHDHLGSANTGTSANGLVSWREQYTPFGETLTNPSPNDDRDGFTGHIKDAALGLNYMQARYYDPLTGRFLSTDPVGFSPSQPFMFGRYTYVGNDPLNGIDPDGKQTITGTANVGPAIQKACGGSNACEQQVGKDMLIAEAKLGVAVASLFVPGPEDVVIAGAVSTKVGQTVAKTFQTYTKANKKTGQVYTGRTSGTGTPLQNIAKRDAGHHKTSDGFGDAQMDRTSSNSDAIRGREQQMIDANGGAQSQGGTSGNAINGVADSNPKRDAYVKACNGEFCD